MAERIIYIASRNGKYLTNKTNATRLWEIFIKIWKDEPLEFSYQKKEEDTEYTTVPARRVNLKKLCKEAVKNRLIVHPEGTMDDRISIHQDILGGESE